MSAHETPPPLLRVRDLHVRFPKAIKDAVGGVSFDLNVNEVLGVVGESGSGKSTIARALMGMVEPYKGTIELEGMAVASTARRRPLSERRRLSMVFQDSLAAMAPHFTVERIVNEPLVLTGALRSDGARTARGLLESVGLAPDVLTRHPSELSGGQRQRVQLARALASKPDLLICDEAVSALDVSVQAQILNLLVDLQASAGLAILFITHDLSVVEYLADRVLVMHSGELVEEGPMHQVLDAPREPYTRRLLEARPGAV